MKILSANPVPGFGIRYDASVLSSITKDGSNLISQWGDLANSHNLAQATGTLQALYVANGLNNKPCVRFGETRDEYMTASSMSLGLTPEIFFVASFRTYVATNGLFFSSYPNDFGFAFGAYSAYDTGCYRKVSILNSGGGRAISTTMAYSAPYIVRILFGESGTTDACELQMNNNPTINFTHSGNSGSNTWDNFSLGWNQFESARNNFDVSEIIIYPTGVPLNDAQRNHNIDYLNKKWGIF